MRAPIALSEAQMATLFAASHLVPPHLRGQFLKECATTLANVPTIGDGNLHRVVQGIQQAFLRGDPPVSRRQQQRDARWGQS